MASLLAWRSPSAELLQRLAERERGLGGMRAGWGARVGTGGTGKVRLGLRMTSDELSVAEASQPSAL